VTAADLTTIPPYAPSNKKRDDDALLLWRDHTGRQFSGLLTHDGWDYELTPDSLGIYVSDVGQRLSPGDQRALAMSFMTGVSADLKDTAARMIAGDISSDEWRDKVQSDIDDEFLLLAALGAGGFDNLTPADEATIMGRESTPRRMGSGILDAQKRLASFKSEIDAGEFTPGEALRRVGQYAHPGYEVFQTTRSDALARMELAKGLRLEERSVLDPFAKHCRDSEFALGCPTVAAAGWQPVGTLPQPGADRTCGGMCRCTMIHRIVAAPVNPG
jgi:hypothetical protein